jgi:hypothetical protein
MKCVQRALTTIAHLVGCTPASEAESPKWTPIVQNIVDTCRTLHQLLKGKQLSSTLQGMYTEVHHNLMEFSEKAMPKGKQPRPQLLHLCPMRNSVNKADIKWKPSDRNKRAKKPTTFDALYSQENPM